MLSFQSSLCAVVVALTFCTQGMAGTIVHYAFDNDFTDSSGNGFDGQLDTTPSKHPTFTATSAFGSHAAEFDASSLQHLVAPVDSQLQGLSELTISTWLRPVDLSGGNHRIFQWAGDPELRLTAHNNTSTGANRALRFDVNGLRRDSAAEVNNVIPNDGQFHHVALRYKGGDFVQVLVDGSVVLEENNDADVPATLDSAATVFTIGGKGPTITVSGDFFSGAMDEFFMFDAALSDAQLTSLRESNVVPEPTGFVIALLGLLPFAVARRRRSR